jgi:site-specific DNA-methyltransferase (adenine-specific)
MVNQIFNLDCLELMGQMASDKIDLTVTSPPYDSLRRYHGYSFDANSIIKELYRVTKQGGVVVWVVGDQTINGSESGESFRQALSFKETGFLIHDTMIYQKMGLGFTPKDKYYQSFEYMFVFSKGKPKTFNPIQVDRTGHKHGSVGCKSRGTQKKIKYDPTKKTRNANNIWLIANHSKNAAKDDLAYQHEAIFPEELARNHILSWSNPGDLIFDPMAGSGTTGVQAALNNRNYLLADCSKEYCELMKQRLELRLNKVIDDIQYRIQ